MVIYSNPIESKGDTVSTFEDRFGECHDDASLWAMRREIDSKRTNEDRSADLVLISTMPRNYPNARQYVSLRTLEGQVYSNMVHGARAMRRAALSTILRNENYQTLIDGEAIYTPGVEDRCDASYGSDVRECSHHRSAHDQYDGCLIDQCECMWDGRDSDPLTLMIMAEGYMI